MASFFQEALKQQQGQKSSAPSDTAGVTPFQSGFRGVEDIALNAPQNYWGKDGSFNIAGGAAPQSSIQSALLAQFPQLAGIINQYGSSQPPAVADLRASNAGTTPPPQATVPQGPSGGKGSGGKSPNGRNVTGASWNPNSTPNLEALIQSSMQKQQSK